MKAQNKFTNIVATLGLVSKDPETLKKLVAAGVNVFRLNFSHGTHESHLEVINNIKAINQELEYPVAIMLDTKGPEIRTGMLKDPVELQDGEQLIFTIDRDQPYETTGKVSVSYDAFLDDVSVGDTILIESGLMTVKVTAKQGHDVLCQILEGGTLTSTRHLTIPGKKVTLESITEQDKRDIEFGLANGIDMIALSFVRSGDDIRNLRKFLHEHQADDVDIISKVENCEGVSNLEDIIRENDAVMIARGDLGADLSLKKVPAMQERIMQLCTKYCKPVIVATEMLESMINNPLPTRAEITDVYNAIRQNTDCVMLSGESAKGKYPIKAVETLAAVALEGEHNNFANPRFAEDREIEVTDIWGAMAKVAFRTTREVADVALTVVMTKSGNIARKVSNCRPKTPIITFTNNPRVQRKLQLSWGVVPHFMELPANPDPAVLEQVDHFLSEHYSEFKGRKYVLLCEELHDQELIPTLQIKTIK